MRPKQIPCECNLFYREIACQERKPGISSWNRKCTGAYLRHGNQENAAATLPLYICASCRLPAGSFPSSAFICCHCHLHCRFKADIYKLFNCLLLLSSINRYYGFHCRHSTYAAVFCCSCNSRFTALKNLGNVSQHVHVVTKSHLLIFPVSSKKERLAWVKDDGKHLRKERKEEENRCEERKKKREEGIQKIIEKRD